MKARVFCIFVVITGEGQSLESLWRHPTHEWYIPPVRPFLTNLQAVKSCLRPVRTLHKTKAITPSQPLPTLMYRCITLNIYNCIETCHCGKYFLFSTPDIPSPHCAGDLSPYWCLGCQKNSRGQLKGRQLALDRTLTSPSQTLCALYLKRAQSCVVNGG